MKLNLWVASLVALGAVIACGTSCTSVDRNPHNKSVEFLGVPHTVIGCTGSPTTVTMAVPQVGGPTSNLTQVVCKGDVLHWEDQSTQSSQQRRPFSIQVDNKACVDNDSVTAPYPGTSANGGIDLTAQNPGSYVLVVCRYTLTVKDTGGDNKYPAHIIIIK